MISEKDFEDIICKYPELIEDGLVFKGRQIHVRGKIMDMLFEDRFRQKLIIELKVGPIDRKHIGQVMEYEGSVLSSEDPTARIMLVGNRVPPNLKKSLDHHGIEWKEIPLSQIRDFLISKNDERLKLFQDIDGGVSLKTEAQPLEVVNPVHSPTEGMPALFSPVDGKWIGAAFEYFKSGKERLYFYTNANVGKAMDLDIKNVYFKAKGEDAVSAKADFVELTEENPLGYRLPGSEKETGKYYYGYKNIQWLNNAIKLVDLQYYKTSTKLRVDVPGPCIILDPAQQAKDYDSQEYLLTCFSKTRIALNGPYDSAEAFEKISLSGGSGTSKADKLYRRLLKYINQVKEDNQKVLITSPQICEHVYFGIRTRRFIIYICEEKHGIEAVLFKKSDVKRNKFSAFILQPH